MLSRAIARNLCLILWLTVLASQQISASEARLNAPEGERRFLTVEVLSGEAGRAPEALHYGHFMPLGQSGPAQHEFSGRLTMPAFPLRRAEGNNVGAVGEGSLPGFSMDFFSQDGLLVPVERGIIRNAESGPWDIILSPGKVWSEATDEGWSRAAFPFTLVDQRWGGSRNGVATFLYDDSRVSELRLQVAQEASPNWQFDLWAQAPAGYAPGEVAMRDSIWAALSAERAARVPWRPWSDLEEAYGEADLEGFDGGGVRPYVTVSGLLIDGTFYLRPCRTRLGPYPFCEEMRHAVYSQTKTLGALIAMLRLAEVYGPEVWDEKILDYVPLKARHDGWEEVTFRDALNMATGIGNLEPRRVDHYVEADASPLSMRVGRAPTVVDKLAAISLFEDYPWGPGEVFRYRSVDTFVLAMAMDRFLKSREGAEARLWDMVEREVFAPLSLGPLPIVETREAQAERRIPMLGYGMLPTFDQVLRLSQLLQRGGAWEGKQVLHRELTKESVDHSRQHGLPTGWRYKEGGEAHYHLAFWRTPHRAESGCTVSLPVMGGYGGNYLLIMPGETIALRFADGDDNAPSTWDSYVMRMIADDIVPFC